MATITINAAAEKKGCSRQAIYNNKNSFTWDNGRIVVDKKFETWQKKQGVKRGK